MCEYVGTGRNLAVRGESASIQKCMIYGIVQRKGGEVLTNKSSRFVATYNYLKANKPL